MASCVNAARTRPSPRAVCAARLQLSADRWAGVPGARGEERRGEAEDGEGGGTRHKHDRVLLPAKNTAMEDTLGENESETETTIWLKNE